MLANTDMKLQSHRNAENKQKYDETPKDAK